MRLCISVSLCQTLLRPINHWFKYFRSWLELFEKIETQTLIYKNNFKAVQGQALPSKKMKNSPQHSMSFSKVFPSLTDGHRPITNTFPPHLPQCVGALQTTRDTRECTFLLNWPSAFPLGITTSGRSWKESTAADLFTNLAKTPTAGRWKR